MIIREANVNDAKNFLDMLYILDTQTKDMLFEEGERKGSIERTIDRIQSMSGENGLTLVIDDDDKVGGFLSSERGKAKRINHSAYIVIGMLKQYRDKNLGTKMFQMLEDWAIKNNITRLELTVVKTNERAVHLYKKMGFKIEGLKEKSMIVDNKYVDEYYMAKLI